MLVARIIRRVVRRLAARGPGPSPSSEPCKRRRSPRRGAPPRRPSPRAGALDLAAPPAESTAPAQRGRRRHRRGLARTRLPGRVLAPSTGCSVPGTSMTGQSSRNARHRRGVERRRHHHDAQVVARQPGLPRQGEPEVGVDAALVELVEHHRGDVRQQRVLLQLGGQHALGDDEQARVGGRSGARSARAIPTSRPSVQPCSSAMRRAMARAATRRGCSTNTRPASISAGGTRVVLPAPGAAISTAARREARALAELGDGGARRAARRAAWMASVHAASCASPLHGPPKSRYASRLTARGIRDAIFFAPRIERHPGT